MIVPFMICLMVFATFLLFLCVLFGNSGKFRIFADSSGGTIAHHRDVIKTIIYFF